MWDKQLNLESAMDYVDQLVRKRLQEYVQAKAQLRSFGPELDDKVARYIQGLEYAVQGSISWTFMTPRELCAGYEFPTLTSIIGYFGENAEIVRETGLVDITIAPPKGITSA